MVGGPTSRARSLARRGGGGGGPVGLGVSVFVAAVLVLGVGSAASVALSSFKQLLWVPAYCCCFESVCTSFGT